jgi:hypothetical protein
MAETSVTIPLCEIIDEWLEKKGITLEWSYEQLIREKDFLQLVLEFDYPDISGKYPDVKYFLDTYGDDE